MCTRACIDGAMGLNCNWIHACVQGSGMWAGPIARLVLTVEGEGFLVMGGGSCWSCLYVYGVLTRVVEAEEYELL